MRTRLALGSILLIAWTPGCKSFEAPPPVGTRTIYTDKNTGQRRQSVLLEAGGRYSTISRLSISRGPSRTGEESYALGLQYMMPSDVVVFQMDVSVDGAQMRLPGRSQLVGVESTASENIGTLYRFIGEYQMNKIQAQAMAESASVSIVPVAADDTRLGVIKLSPDARQSLRMFVEEDSR